MLSSTLLTASYKEGIHRHQTPARYRNAAGGGPSHDHRGSAQKIREDRPSSSRDVLADRQTDKQTDSQTDKLIAILRTRCTDAE